MVRVLLLFLLALFLGRAFWRLIGGVVDGAIGAGHAAAPRPRRDDGASVKMVKDPVCGTFVVPGKALALTRGGGTEWFCSERCRAEFTRR